MKNFVCFFTICFFFSFHSSSQIGVNSKKDAENADTFKNRPLLVVLRDADKDEERSQFNENLKKALEKVWTYSKIEGYITYDEWVNLSKDKTQKDKYSIMHYTERDLQGNAPALCLGIGLMENKILTHFVDLNLKDNVVSDIIIALITLQSDLNLGKLNSSKIKEQGNNISGLLSTKTLIIDEYYATDELKKEMSKIYPHNFKFTNKEDIDNLIVNQDEKYLYMKLIQVKSRPLVSTGEGGKEIDKKINISGTVFICLFNLSNNEFLYRYLYRGKDGISSKDVENLLKLKF